MFFAGCVVREHVYVDVCGRPSLSTKDQAELSARASRENPSFASTAQSISASWPLHCDIEIAVLTRRTSKKRVDAEAAVDPHRDSARGQQLVDPSARRAWSFATMLLPFAPLLLFELPQLLLLLPFDVPRPEEPEGGQMRMIHTMTAVYDTSRRT
jgi:hypothetical protein